MSVITWLLAKDCDPPHGLDLSSEHDASKVAHLVDAFSTDGFDKSKAAIIGYVKNGRVQFLSGTHRHEAGLITGIKLPVVLWLGSDIDKAWGILEDWRKIMADISVDELETWTRDDIERMRVRICGQH